MVIAVAAGFGLWKYHEQPAFCGNTCHIMQPYLETWSKSNLLAHDHAAAGVTCIQCHEPDIRQQVDELTKFLLGRYQVPLEQRELGTVDFCIKCHEHGSYEQVIELSAGLQEELGRNPHSSHNGELDCGMCHRAHAPSTLYCEQCHMVPTPKKGVWK